MIETVDRIAPTRRPDRRAAGTQRWRSLAFLHWTFPPEVVRPHVPAALELDLLDGRAAVGLVPFAMEDVRPWWWPPSVSLSFLETNVRTYVVHRGRPGVWFFSLDASNLPAVVAARVGWGLPYVHARMELERRAEAIRYASRRPARPGALDLTLVPGEPLGPSAPGTREHFLLERYLLFVERGGTVRDGQVHHAPYPAHAASVGALDDSLLAAAGLKAPGGPPEFVHYAPGVDVEVFGLRRVS
ncbi:MAG: YqjF family protein [Planctomycetota bacterium JB042]